MLETWLLVKGRSYWVDHGVYQSWSICWNPWPSCLLWNPCQRYNAVVIKITFNSLFEAHLVYW